MIVDASLTTDDLRRHYAAKYPEYRHQVLDRALCFSDLFSLKPDLKFKDLDLWTPELACRFARHIDNCNPTKRTRDIACLAADTAIAYALYIDRKPHRATRNAACIWPMSAAYYAYCIDKKPRKQTRDAACGHPESALHYAQNVDKKPCKQTRDAAAMEHGYFLLYRRWETSL